ncbi:hypothetical protein Tco_0053606 [Tanacetum coccineum]
MTSKLSSYASGHYEVSELAACLENASYSCTSGHVEVYQKSDIICHLECSFYPKFFRFDMIYAPNFFSSSKPDTLRPDKY